MRNDALTLYYFVTCLNGIAELTNTLLPYSGNLALAVVVQGIQTDQLVLLSRRILS